MDENRFLIEAGKEAIQRAFKFLEVILIPPLEEVGLLAQDQIKLWRFKNQVRILNKAQDFLEKRGIPPKQIPLKFLLPLLENGSLEEEPSMQERWAALLARAADPNSLAEPIPAQIEILKQLSPLEAQILDLMYDYNPFNPPQEIISAEERDKKIIEKTNISHDLLSVIQSYLIRLGLIEEIPEKKPTQRITTNAPTFHTVKGPTELTDIGYIFVRNCRIDSQKNS